MLTILITGFGPFPTAPMNPTGPLVHRLARLRRPALADVRLVPHVFTTSYQAVDRELPRLIARHAPDAMLMFGLAGRRRALSVETRARNAASMLLPDVTGGLSAGGMIVGGAPGARLFAPWCRNLPRALRSVRVPAYLSRDAGRYVCNYLCWRAIEQTAPDGPVLAFVHVPKIARVPRRPQRRRALTADDLARAGTALLLAMVAETRRRRRH